MSILFVVAWKRYAHGHMYQDAYIVQEGLMQEHVSYEVAQEMVNELNSAPSHIIYYVSTEEDFFAEMPPLVPYAN